MGKGNFLHSDFEGFGVAFAADPGGDGERGFAAGAVEAEALGATGFQRDGGGAVAIVDGELGALGTGTVPLHLDDVALGDGGAVDVECHFFHDERSTANCVPRNIFVLILKKCVYLRFKTEGRTAP